MSPIAFISYSHDSAEHAAGVLALAQRLRDDGIQTSIDRFVEGTPKQGWPRWMMDQVSQADFILMICTASYFRRFVGHETPGFGEGADFEGALIAQKIYEEPAEAWRVVPVLFSANDRAFIPTPLRRHTYYSVPSRYNDLLSFLHGRAGVAPARLGTAAPIGSGRAEFHWSGRPAPPDHFVGRSRELWDLEVAVLHSDAPLVAVCAVGGQGKTALVARWLSDYENAAAHEFDRICYVSAYRFGLEYVAFLEFAAESLGCDVPPNASTAVLARLLIGALRKRRSLLVVDGLERWLEGSQLSPATGRLWTEASRTEQETARGLGALLAEIACLTSGSKLLFSTRAIPASLDHVASKAMIKLGATAGGGLPGLNEREGLLLLSRLRVKGPDDEKRRCVTELAGHPLSLRVLGSILAARGRPIEKRAEIYGAIVTLDEKLAAILRQAEALCGTDVRVLQIAALAPEDCPIAAIEHAIGQSSTPTKILLSMNQLAEWGLLSLAGPKRDHVQLHPLVRSHFAAAPDHQREAHALLSEYFASTPISANARSLNRVAPRIWAVEHAVAAGDHARAVRLLIDEPLTPHAAGTGAGERLTLSTWFQMYGQSAFELEWTRKIAATAPPREKLILLNSMVIASQRCGLLDVAERLIEEALRMGDGRS